jgi:hypothetical protein
MSLYLEDFQRRTNGVYIRPVEAGNESRSVSLFHVVLFERYAAVDYINLVDRLALTADSISKRIGRRGKAIFETQLEKEVAKMPQEVRNHLSRRTARAGELIRKRMPSYVIEKNDLVNYLRITSTHTTAGMILKGRVKKKDHAWYKRNMEETWTYNAELDDKGRMIRRQIILPEKLEVWQRQADMIADNLNSASIETSDIIELPDMTDPILIRACELTAKGIAGNVRREDYLPPISYPPGVRWGTMTLDDVEGWNPNQS